MRQKTQAAGITRRSFLMSTAGLVTGCATVRRGPRRVSPNETVNVACVGVGGMGGADVQGVAASGANIVALCDVDWVRAAESFEAFPNARRFTDYRVMLDKVRDIDAVTVSTPDHMHAPVAMAAMDLGLHVRVQKPMTWCIEEARRLTKMARRRRVVSAMGNQGHSGDGVRQLCEMLWDDAIGPVREVHIWTDRPDSWPQGMKRPLPGEPTRPKLDWNLWLGVAPKRAYNDGYCPSDWRGWWDFGCGALGDMGCHIMDPANWALQLGPPSHVECIMGKGNTDQSPPPCSIVKYTFPERKFREPYPSVKWYGRTLPPVTVYWYDGALPDGSPNLPPRPEGVPDDEKLGNGDNGSYFVGDDGLATTCTYGQRSRLLPDARMADYTMPDEVIPRVPDGNPYLEWLTACKGGTPIGSRFDYAGPFTETVLLGNLAVKVGEGQVIEWDAKRMRSPNCPEADEYLSREYREDW